MIETRAIFKEPQDVQQATYRLKMILSKFAGEKGDLKAVLEKHNFKFEELLTLLDSSLAIQKEEIDRLRKDAKRLTNQLENSRKDS